MVRARVCRLASFVALGAVVLAPATAAAGRTDFGWLFGTETMPERGVELQQWLYEENGRPGLPDQTLVWWGPVIGLTDQLELSLPIELAWTGPSIGDDAHFTLADYGADLRYRFVSEDPVEAGPVVPLVRLAVKRDVVLRDAVIVEGDFVLGYQSGCVHALLDAGVTSELSADDHYVFARPGAGVSVEVKPDLRFGAEVETYLQVAGDGEYRWVAAGPNLAWTHGRFWLSGAFDVGIYHIRTAPRIVWGIAF